MSVTPLDFQDFIGTTADEQRWQICNAVIQGGGGGGGTTNSNVAVASNGTTRAPLNLDSAGRLIVDIGSSIQLDSITVNTDQIEGKIDTSNALLTTIQSDLASTLSSNVSITGGIGTSAATPLYDSIVGGTVSLGSSISIAGGQSLTSARSWNLATNTDSLTAVVSSIPAVSLASGQSLASAGYVSIPATFVTGQSKIAVTGTAVQLGSNALTQGVLISALSTNAASITIGTSSSVTNVVNGTGNGAILTAGSTKSIAATNTNLIWINGTAGDIISFIGS
jgi:hypothetical protein